MSRRREYQANSSKIEPIIITYLNNASISESDMQSYLDTGYTKISFFIVGGGGAGTGDFYDSDNDGYGGCGGECITIQNLDIIQDKVSIYIGAGGTGGTRDCDGNNGGDTYCEYNGETYKAAGGWGGKAIFNQKTVFSYYERGQRKWGGCGGWYASYPSQFLSQVKTYYNMTPEQGIEYRASSAASNYWYSIKGETGVKNPFDSNDTMVYGCGGGAGYNAYRGGDLTDTYPNYSGDNNVGGGRGGYGSDNATTNKGSDATSYGSGGGGGAFSSQHTYSLGGSGKQGCVIVQIS